MRIGTTLAVVGAAYLTGEAIGLVAAGIELHRARGRSLAVLDVLETSVRVILGERAPLKEVA